jgi:hypothetical protein
MSAELKELETKAKRALHTRDAAEWKFLNAVREVQDYKLANGEPLNAVRKRKEDTAAAAAESAPASDGAAKKGGKKDKNTAAPKKQKAAAPAPAPAAAAEATGDWVCDGNVITGKPHVNGDTDATSTRAANTKHNGKTYVSCKACKKEIKKSKAAQKE